MRGAGLFSVGCLLGWLLLGQAASTVADTTRKGMASVSSLAATIESLRSSAKEASDSSYGARIFALENSEPQRTLKTIQQTLARIGDAATPALLPLLEDPDWRVNEAAADILQPSRDPHVQAALIDYCMRRILDKPRKTKVLEGPGYKRLFLFGAAALPFITREWNNPAHRNDLDYLASLVRVLAAMPNHAGLPLIARAIRHPCAPVAAAAATVLPRAAGKAALPLLVELLERKPTGCLALPGPILECDCAVDALKALGNPDAVEPLLQLLIRLGPLTEAQRRDPLLFERYPDCREVAKSAIDTLTGQALNGVLAQIRAWVDTYKRRSQPMPAQ